MARPASDEDREIIDSRIRVASAISNCWSVTQQKVLQCPDPFILHVKEKRHCPSIWDRSCFSFIRNQRQGNWLGTLESIEMMCPYFFAFGHTNYSWWVPVFLQDTAQLPTLHPDVHDNFMKGHFVVQRSEKFSRAANRPGISGTCYGKGRKITQYGWHLKYYGNHKFCWNIFMNANFTHTPHFFIRISPQTHV